MPNITINHPITYTNVLQNITNIQPVTYGQIDPKVTNNAVSSNNSHLSE